MSDLITDTAKRIGVDPKSIFRRAAKGKRFSNADEVADYRFQRWFKFGEVAPFVESFCLDQWRTEDVGQHQTHGAAIS